MTGAPEFKAAVAARLCNVPNPTPAQEVVAFVDALLEALAATPGADDYTAEEVARARRMFFGRLDVLPGEAVAWMLVLVAALTEAGHE